MCIYIYMVRSEILNAKMVILHLSAFFFVVYPALDSIHIYMLACTDGGFLNIPIDILYWSVCRWRHVAGTRLDNQLCWNKFD